MIASEHSIPFLLFRSVPFQFQLSTLSPIVDSDLSASLFQRFLTTPKHPSFSTGLGSLTLRMGSSMGMKTKYNI